MFLGAAVGLRISNLPVLCGFFLLAWPGEHFRWRVAVNCILLYIAGYALANVVVLDNFGRAMEHALGISPSGELSGTRFFEVIVECAAGEGREWDLASAGSIVYWWGGRLLPVALLFALAKSREYKVLAAIVTSFAVGLLAVGFRGLGYGWYFMPTVAASYVVAINTIRFETWELRPRRALVAVLAVALLLSAHISLGELRRNRDREAVLLDQERSAASVRDALVHLKRHDRLLLLMDPTSTIIEPPNDKFVAFHDALPLLNDPQSFELAESMVVTTKEMERQSSLVARFMKHLREHRAHPQVPRRVDRVLADTPRVTVRGTYGGSARLR